MKTIRYKLTQQDMTTHNGCKWELNKWKETGGEGNLCSSGWLHCYSNPLIAILLNPIHANILSPRLFKVEVEGETLNDNGLKEGWNRMRLIKELDIPKITREQRMTFSILCALEVYKDEKFVEWANNWLSGEDRTQYAADDAYSATLSSYASAAAATATNSVDAAYSAARSAYYTNASSAYSAANAAYYAARSVSSASSAYYAANDNHININLIDIVNKAMEIK